jgi:hypothetical protein
VRLLHVLLLNVCMLCLLTCHVPCQAHPLTIFGEQHKLWSPFLSAFSVAFCYFLHFSSNTFLSHLFSKTLSPFPSLSVREQGPHPCKTPSKMCYSSKCSPFIWARKVMFMCILWKVLRRSLQSKECFTWRSCLFVTLYQHLTARQMCLKSDMGD